MKRSNAAAAAFAAELTPSASAAVAGGASAAAAVELAGVHVADAAAVTAAVAAVVAGDSPDGTTAAVAAVVPDLVAEADVPAAAKANPVKPKCHQCGVTPSPKVGRLLECTGCNFLFCPATPCFYEVQFKCKECAPKLLREVELRKDQEAWWTHTSGGKNQQGKDMFKRALLHQLEDAVYLTFDQETGECTNDAEAKIGISLFTDTASGTEVQDLQTLVEPLIKEKSYKETGLGLENFQMSFALQEGGGLQPGGDEMVVEATSLLGYLKAATAQDTKNPQPTRKFMATADISSTHSMATKSSGIGVAKYELTIQGNAWYLFKPPDGMGEFPMALRIVEVKAGSSIMIRGECYKWGLLLLRTDLGRAGPIALATPNSIKRVTASMTYGDDLPCMLQLTPARPLPPPPQSETKKKPSRGNKKTEEEPQVGVTTDSELARDNFWRSDQPDGKPIGAFQPTFSIQGRAASSPIFCGGTKFPYKDPSGLVREVHLVMVGRMTMSNGTMQRVVVAQMRPLEITNDGVRPVSGWGRMTVFSANQVRTYTHTHTHWSNTHTHARTYARSCQAGLSLCPWAYHQVQHLPTSDYSLTILLYNSYAPPKRQRLYVWLKTR